MKKEESFKAYQMVSMYLMALMGIERAFSITKLFRIDMRELKEKMAAGYGVDLDKLEGVVR